MASLQRIGDRVRTLFRCGSLVLVTVLSAAAVVGCGDSESSVTTVPTQLKCQVALAVSSPSIGPDGGTGTVTVSTAPECAWDVSTATSWLSGLSPASGQGSSTVEFRVAPNALPSVRQGEIVVNDSRIPVSQQGAPCRFELRPDRLTVEADGEVRDVAVSTVSGCSWTVASDASWISFATQATGNGPGSVRVNIAPNPADERTGTITLAGQRSTVSQAGAGAGSGPPAPGCTYQLGAPSANIAATGGTGTVGVSAANSCAWSASSSAAWVTIASGVSGNGNGSVTFNVATNTGAARSGTLTIARQTFTVSQAAATVSCTYSISAPSASIAAAGGTGAVGVSSGNGCAWTASSSAGWVTVTSGSSGSGGGSVAFSVAANSGNVRSATLSIADQTFIVSQAAVAVACTYSISAPSASIAAAGGTGAVGVSSGNGCAWTASSSAGWVTVTSGSSGTGDGSVAFSVAANNGGARSGTLSVAGQTFTVSQAAEVVSCTYSISSTNASLAAGGGTGTVGVSAGNGCTWTASSNAGWITINSGSSGSGGGSVAFSVAANSGGARSGTVSIAGHTFTVSQAAEAVSCTYSISPTSVSINGAANGSVTVSTSSGCAWTASSNVDWITITSGTSGTGSGSVAYSATSPRGKNDRTGTVTIAGSTFTVRQTN